MWGLAVLGLTGALASLLTFRADKVAAQQHPIAADVMTTANVAVMPSAFSIRVVKVSADKLKLKGLVATEEDHKALMGLVKASFPSADVSDRLKIAAGAKTDMKLGGISFALKALSFLQAGAASIDENGVSLSGGTEDGSTFTEFKKFVAAPPTGVIVREDIVTQPLSSVSWRAEIGNGKVRLTGAVADKSDKKELEATVQALFAGLEIVDETSVAGGASESWLDAAMHSLQVLCLLDSGFVQLADHKIQLYGQASDEAKLRKIDSLADNYPSSFALDSKVSAPTQASMFGLPSLPTISAAAERLPVADGSTGVPTVAIGAAR